MRGKNPVFRKSHPNFSTTLRAFVMYDLSLELFPTQERHFRAEVHWEQLVPPISKGQYVGHLDIIDDLDRVYRSVNIYADNAVNPSIEFWLRRYLSLGAEKLYELRVLPLFLLLLLLLALFWRWR